MPLVGGSPLGLGNFRVEVGQQIGGDLPSLDGFRDATQQPGLEGLRGIGRARLHGWSHAGFAAFTWSVHWLRQSQVRLRLPLGLLGGCPRER
jgi:hypothetical protein